MEGKRVDFFVSHAGADSAWAEWVAWQLIDAGYSVELDLWDWAAGRNFVTAMSDALDRCDRVVALFSRAYFDRSRYTTEEWSVATLHLPGLEQGRLVPVRVERVPSAQVPALLRPLVYRDLFGVAEEQARQALLEAAAGPRRPGEKPVFPGRKSLGPPGSMGLPEPRLPGRMPRVWSIPARNPSFTGRDGLLIQVREALRSRERAVVQALHGMGGVGKTQLAAEYAHRFAQTYELAWWVNSEQAGLIGEQFAALGHALGCIPAGAPLPAVQDAVLGELRERGGWLLVFDNAEAPADIRDWLPGGDGHVLITSRQRCWDEIAVPVEVDVLARPESAAILQGRVTGLTEADADRLAIQLGDLALAVAQAAGYMAETSMPAAEYLDLLGTRAGQLLAQAPSGSFYPRSLAVATGLIAERLAKEDSAAAELASMCAFLAPEPIPEEVFTSDASNLSAELAARVADPLAWRQTLAHMTRQSLARIDHHGLQMHRLTQAILRDRLPPQQAAATRARTETILAASNPGDPPNPATWPQWVRLMPHLLAADLAATESPGLRQMVCDACWYMISRGDIPACNDLASHLREQWRERSGADDPYTLSISHFLAWTHRAMHRYAAARDVDQDTVTRRRRVRGEDDPGTLISAAHLASDLQQLGEMQAARDLHQDTLDRMRRVLGEDHASTLFCAGELAIDLRMLGEVQAARNLNQDTLDRRRRILGRDHPTTLSSANNLAVDLYALGEVQAARNLNQDTLDRRRRILGKDHTSTWFSATNLAENLRALGEVQAARDLDQDTLDRRLRLLGADHRDTLFSANNLAADLRMMGEVRAARDLDQDTLNRRGRVLGEEHPATLASAANLAADLRALGET